jgi:hypothetical protein
VLKQNTTILAQYPFRQMGGGAAFMRSMYGRGDRVNQFASEGINSKQAAVPSGHLAPSAWLLPQEAGGMSSRNEAVAVIIAAGNAAQGLNLVANSVLTLLVDDGNAAAVAAASGAATLVLSVSGSAVAPINAIGSASATLTAGGAQSAIATVTGSAVCAISPSLTTQALGFMIAQPITVELTPDQIALAVWSALASANNDAGTMGEKLNDAGAAGNPWAALLADNIAPDTFGEFIQERLDEPVSAGGGGDCVGGIVS